MTDSTEPRPPRKAAKIDKPPKPYPTFPLSPANCGAWQKKINGRIHYFGKWGRVVDGVLTRIQEDGCWQEALKLYEAQAEDLHAGRRPRGKRSTPDAKEDDRLTVAELCNRFLTAKHRKVASGEIGSRMFNEYKETTDLLVAAFGKSRLVEDLAADDFQELRAAMAKRWGPVRLGNAITRIKSVFKYGLDNALLDRTPRYGSEFKKPEKAVLRRHRAQNGEKMLEPHQIRAMVEGALVVGKNGPELVRASTQLRALILLGINAGFGNTDVSTLPLSALDLERGWLNFPRPKTGIPRRCPLWPETVTAIRKALAERPKPKDKADADIVFLQATGRRWVRPTGKAVTNNLSVRFGELLKNFGLYRDGFNFYALWHTFRTVADAARDPVAIDLIMGHADPSMGGHYRERIDDSRLRAVADHVRQWLFGEPPGDGPTGPTPENSDPCDPCDPEEKDGSGSDGAEGSQKNAPAPAAPTRPALRLFVG